MLGQEVVRVFRGMDTLAPGGPIRTSSQRLALPGKASVTRHIQVTAAAVGDVAFLGLDCEALVEIGKEIKARSPFKHTFILTNCNGGSGYLPPAHRYPEGGYEVEISGFGPEAAGMVVESAIKTLSSLRR